MTVVPRKGNGCPSEAAFRNWEFYCGQNPVYKFAMFPGVCVVVVVVVLWGGHEVC